MKQNILYPNLLLSKRHITSNLNTVHISLHSTGQGDRNIHNKSNKCNVPLVSDYGIQIIRSEIVYKSL